MNWFENEAFWRDGYEFMFDAEAFQRAPEQIDQALALTGTKGGTALDLCCGPGRHTAALATRGLTVTGVDLSPFLLNVAKEHAAAQGMAPEFVLADMRTFVRPNTFDLAVNLFTSFGYFENVADDQRVLANVFASLRPGGAMLVDLMGKEIMARGWGDRVVESASGAVCVQRVEIIEDWSKVKNRWIVIRGDTARFYEFVTRAYSGQELRGLMERAGFANVRLFGGLDGSPYGRSATRLVAIGEKHSEKSREGLLPTDLS